MDEKKPDHSQLSNYESMHFWNTLQFLNNKEHRPLLENLINCILVRILAKKRNLTISDTELQTAANWFRNSLGLNKAEDTFVYLKNAELEVADLEFLLEMQLLYHKLKQSLSSVDVVQEVFSRNLQMFEVVELAGLPFDAWEEAEEFYERLIKGKVRFPDPVANLSGGLPDKKNSIHIGFVTRTDLGEEVAAKVFADDALEFEGPVKFESRFWIYHVLLPKRIEVNEIVYDLCEELFFHDFLRKKQTEILGPMLREFPSPTTDVVVNPSDPGA